MRATLHEKYQLVDVMSILGVDIAWLADETGLCVDATRRAVLGGTVRTHIETAEAIAKALGMHLEEIDWPSGITLLGRPPFTGRPLQRTSHLVADLHEKSRIPSCEEHFLALSAAGNCSYCEAEAAQAIRA